MKQTQYIPVPQKKSGWGCIVLPLLFVGMVGVCLFIAPQLEQGRPTPAQPQWFVDLQHKIGPVHLPSLPNVLATTVPGKKTGTPSQKKAGTLSSPSGTCFDLARTAARQAGIDPTLYARQINQESGCQASVCSSAGACGVAQLMPEMAAAFHVDPMNVSQSLATGAHLMAGYLKTYQGSWALALACYNAGSNATAYALKTYGNNWLTHLPLETQNYVAAILGNEVGA